MPKTKKSKGMKRGKSRKVQRETHIMTIPELRRAFEHIESFVEINCHTPKDQLIKEFRQEWVKTFKKEVDEVSAKAYVEHILNQVKDKKPHQRRHAGGAMPLTGAPIAYDTVRPGIYISPGVNEGSYAQVPAYVQSGFWNPEQSHSYDPVPGQTAYVTRTPAGLGDNTVMKGGSRKKQRGGDWLSDVGTAFKQALFHIPTSPQPPSGPIEHAQLAWRGERLPPSPDATYETRSNSGPPYTMTPNTPILNLPYTGKGAVFGTNVFF